MVGFTYWSIEPTIKKANNIFEKKYQIIESKLNDSQAKFFIRNLQR